MKEPLPLLLCRDWNRISFDAPEMFSNDGTIFDVAWRMVSEIRRCLMWNVMDIMHEDKKSESVLF